MSEEQVKEQLPRVQVQYKSGAVKWASVSGRPRKFAKLTVIGDMVYYEASWEAVAGAVNNGTPITI